MREGPSPRPRVLGGVIGLVLIALLLVLWGLADDAPPVFGPSASATTETTKSTATETTRTATATKATGRDSQSGLPWVEVTDLPDEAARTLALIEAGGPFPYPAKDGSTYRNLNRVLPRERDGYYREYTVATPGEDDRGARRIVVGTRGETYWTGDHYDSFARIRR